MGVGWMGRGEAFAHEIRLTTRILLRMLRPYDGLPSAPMGWPPSFRLILGRGLVGSQARRKTNPQYIFGLLHYTP